MIFLERHLYPFLEFLRSNRQAQRLGLLLSLGLLLWLFALSLSGGADGQRSRIALQEDRFRRLAQVVRTYRNQPRQEEPPARGGDLLSGLSSLIDQVGVKDRLVQLSMSTAGATLQLDRLYGEELATLLQELNGKGLPLLSAELRSAPQGEGRLFFCSLLVGGGAR